MQCNRTENITHQKYQSVKRRNFNCFTSDKHFINVCGFQKENHNWFSFCFCFFSVEKNFILKYKCTKRQTYMRKHSCLAHVRFHWLKIVHSQIHAFTCRQHQPQQQQQQHRSAHIQLCPVNSEKTVFHVVD